MNNGVLAVLLVALADHGLPWVNFIDSPGEASGWQLFGGLVGPLVSVIGMSVLLTGSLSRFTPAPIGFLVPPVALAALVSCLDPLIGTMRVPPGEAAWFTVVIAVLMITAGRAAGSGDGTSSVRPRAWTSIALTGIAAAAALAAKPIRDLVMAPLVPEDFLRTVYVVRAIGRLRCWLPDIGLLTAALAIAPRLMRSVSILWNGAGTAGDPGDPPRGWRTLGDLVVLWFVVTLGARLAYVKPFEMADWSTLALVLGAIFTPYAFLREAPWSPASTLSVLGWSAIGGPLILRRGLRGWEAVWMVNLFVGAAYVTVAFFKGMPI